MTYAEAIQYLYGLRWFGAKFGLENTRKLAALAGNPEQRLRFIHVAGTNGKGSTCAILESIYRAAGLRVGLFTSPHLVSFRERVQINRELIPEADVIALVEKTQQVLHEFPAAHQPTFFEVVTVMALQYFAEQKCDLVIWETGLGGRLDATNIVTPLASVITNIGLDHQQWLGDSLAKIAAEKAGIIKPGVPVITATTIPEALEVIKQTAAEHVAPLTQVNPEALADLPLLGLPGVHQQWNAATAVATVEILQPVLSVTPAALRQGLATVHWPGRLQLVARSNGQRVLLDGAHNAEGAQVLRTALQSGSSGLPPAQLVYEPDRRLTFVLGILADKDWQVMCNLLVPLAHRVLLVPVNTERTLPPQELLPICRAANPQADLAVCTSLPEALRQSSNDPTVIIAGSLYLIGEAMELLGLSPTPTADEKALNNWQPTLKPKS